MDHLHRRHSWRDGQDSGAAAVRAVITRGPTEKLVMGAVSRRRGGALASAYEAEVEGVKLALMELGEGRCTTRRETSDGLHELPRIREGVGIVPRLR